jgi:hypothetical protein
VVLDRSPARVPVTVWSPSIAVVQLDPAQLPSGATEKVVAAVSSPRDPPVLSNPSTVYTCDAPTVIAAFAGDSTR